MAESAHGTSCPPSNYIIDSSEAAWTHVSGVIRRNGVAVSTSSATMMLLYWAGRIYRKTKSGVWYRYNAAALSKWQTVSDPTRNVPAPVPPPTPRPLPIGQTKVEFYNDNELVARGKLDVSSGDA